MVKEIGFKIKKDYAAAYERQCKAMHMTVSQRLRELLIHDMTDLSVQIDILKKGIAEMQQELADLEALQAERINNPIIPDTKKANAIKIIDQHLEAFDKDRGVWGPRDYVKRINTVISKTGLSLAEVMQLFKERSLIVVTNKHKLIFFDQVHDYVLADGLKHDDISK